MDVTGLRRLHRTIRNTLLLTASLAASSAWAEGPKVSVDIPSGDAHEMLLEFRRQSGVLPLYPISKIKGHTTQPVAGEFDASEALARMLEGTGITFRFRKRNPHEVQILPPETDVLGARSTPHDPARDSETQLTALAEHVRLAGGEHQLEEVLITGTMIRGLDAITAPLVFLGQQDMKASGRATVHDVVHVLPFTSLAGPREDFGGETNFNRGTSLNLRGLGPGATLVLVNGRRQPASGAYADFVDVSTIPLSAVETIQVMPDGSSALYGSDAIGGVVNIIMRKNLDGAETRTRFASMQGGADETLLAHLHATDWSSGSLLFAYQFSKRASLAASDRAYAADTDKRPFGGSDFSDFRSNPGNILDPLTFQPVWGIPDGQDGSALTPADLLPTINRQNSNRGYELLPKREAHSGYLTVTQQLSDRLELFAEGRFNVRDTAQQLFSATQLLVVPATNPYFVDPFGGSPAVLVAYDFTEDLGMRHAEGETFTAAGVIGLDFSFGRDWKASLTGSFGRERMDWALHNSVDVNRLNAALADPDPRTAFNPFGAGSHTNAATLAAIRTTEKQWTDSRISEASLVADGSLFTVPAGEVKLALGLSYREEWLARRGLIGSQAANADYDRAISALFAEFAVPLLDSIDVSLAGRYERYDDFGSTFNPKIGLRWSPSDQFRVRSSWGTSFRAPALVDLDEARLSSATLLPLEDPKSPTGQSLVLMRIGKNADLHKESATTWTLGFDLLPRAVPGLSLSLTYFAVDYEDRILQPGPASPLNALLLESEWHELITRNPSRALIDEICSSPTFFGVPGSCAAADPAAVVDLRLRNLARTRVDGVDLELNQKLNTSIGQWDVGLKGTYLLQFEQAVSSTSGFRDVRDTDGNPVSFRLRGTADWYQFGAGQPGFSAGVGFNYTGGYDDLTSMPARAVDAWATTDVQIRYRTAPGSQAFNGVEIALGAINVFDEAPPFYNGQLGYDAANAEPLGRIINFYIQKNW